MTDVAFLVALASIIAGVGMIYLPAAFIVGGVLVAVAVLMIERSRNGST